MVGNKEVLHQETIGDSGDTSEEAPVSPWNELAKGLPKNESRPDTSPNENIEESNEDDQEGADKSSNVLASATVLERAYDDRMRAMHEAEARRDRALIAVDHFIFDGTPILDEQRRLIEREGGFDALRRQVLMENALSFGQYELLNAFDGKSRRLSNLSPREIAAVRYLAAQEGLSEIGFISTERARRNAQHEQAVDVMYRAILASPRGTRHINPDSDVPLRDYDTVSPFDSRELERRARERMYIRRNEIVIGSLSGRGRWAGETPSQMDRIGYEGWTYIVDKYGNGDPSRAERRIRDMARAVYTPSPEETRNDRQTVMRNVERIRDQDITQALERLYQTGDISDFTRSVAAMVIGSLPLPEKVSEYRLNIDRSSLTGDERRTHRFVLGQCHGEGKMVDIFQTRIREFRPDDRAFLRDLIITIAHEYYHAYQNVNKNSDSSELAIRHTINFEDYNDYHIDSPGHDHEYHTQLLEREADTYGDAVAARFLMQLDTSRFRRRIA
ncbi:MAG: hypothetical protein K6F57_00985 [Candidatus Saccharibacteria bacterium]|nr:hypothetical protein [Candidatus Saccharibacteria bacterium]